MLAMILKILVPFAVIMGMVTFLIWVERKTCAYIQDRPGPNRAAIRGIRIGGLLHPLTDAIKLLTKEELTPAHVSKPFFIMAPAVAVFVALVTFLVVPFAAPIGDFNFQGADLNIGILYVLAISSLAVYGVMLAGWSSNNKYALLGGVRSSAQMISYELSLGLSLLSILIMSGTFELGGMVALQTQQVWRWNFVVQPLACLVFVVSAFAETNRAPFDLPEGESELVAGYHVEYSSMKFAMFFMAEYAHMIMASALIVTLFFGGWQVPFVSTEVLRGHAAPIVRGIVAGFAGLAILLGLFLVSKFRKGKYGDKRDYEVLILGVPAIVAGVMFGIGLVLVGPFTFSQELSEWVAAGVQIANFLGKVLFMCFVFVWVRWTLPRFRYDQLMHLGWKYMLPLAMANMFVTAVVMLWLK